MRYLGEGWKPEGEYFLRRKVYYLTSHFYDLNNDVDFMSWNDESGKYQSLFVAPSRFSSRPLRQKEQTSLDHQERMNSSKCGRRSNVLCYLVTSSTRLQPQFSIIQTSSTIHFQSAYSPLARSITSSPRKPSNGTSCYRTASHQCWI